MDINLDTDFTKLTDAELIQIKAKWDPVSKVYLKAVNELCSRQAIKEQKQEQYHQQNGKTQRNIKIMTAIILGATIVILFFTVADFLKKSVVIERTTNDKPIDHSNEP